MARKARQRISYASSDISVKVWRPHSDESQTPKTIGLHSDYVKCLATPGSHSDWVASGGLDHKIRIWDLHGAGEKLCIDGGEDDGNAKGSVYALSVKGSMMASGGPESVVRLWDPNTGKRITKFVGHTDNVRDILINHDSDTVISASSDQTVKVWSITAGRCMYTLNMHTDSVWSLYSDHPRLSILYSSDRSGLVAKTDLRGSSDWDEGLSFAVAQEHDGVNKVIAAGKHIWTATSSSSISRWKNPPHNAEIQIPEQTQQHQRWSMASRSKTSSPPSPTNTSGFAQSNISLNSVLRFPRQTILSGQSQLDVDAATMHSGVGTRKMSEAIAEQELRPVLPYHELPDETIEGQHGLIKHVMLNDKRRVLTLDTAGEVMMWDLLKCIPVQSFGKRHLEDVAPEVNTLESVANWCSVDTRTGRLACVLEENFCFDAEAYADELILDNAAEFHTDQRINLGKWILRYLFASLIDEEMVRDEIFRKKLTVSSRQSSSIQRVISPPVVSMPSTTKPRSWLHEQVEDDSLITPRAVDGNLQAAASPGIGVAATHPSASNQNTQSQKHVQAGADEGSRLEKKSSHQSQTKSSTDKPRDYFSAGPNAQGSPDNYVRPPTPGEDTSEASTQSPVDGDKDEKPREGTLLFGKRFRMNFPKKLGRTSVEAKPVVVDEKAEESDRSEDKEEKVVEDNFYGVIQKLRYGYEEKLQADSSQPLVTGICPSLLNETPLLTPPPGTTIIIQEDQPDSGGMADLYRGTVSSTGRDANLIEKAGPMWLGDLLLRNQTPPKEIAKVPFVLLPYQDLLPSIGNSEGSRLNANRMLRARKILQYVAEHIEPPQGPDSLKPEDYLELYCQNQFVSHITTLGALRAHIWKTSGDVVLYYKSNGRKRWLERNPALEQSPEPTVDNGNVPPI
ncbi:MAG: hypothetical protein LQ351_002602 [Letrouitia transgressa]|nr:MAG: hypothetical protein LQ351_002602 [Letrouitia transgressa]